MPKNNVTRKFSPVLYVLLRLTFIPYLVLKYRIKSENQKLFKAIKPPFLLVPNHVSMFDPPMVNIFVPHRVHFVMSDANLRSKIAKWAYNSLCNVIPKTKAVSDASAVRKIIQLVRKRRVICVFAEGRSTWDGVTHDIFFSTAKLIKILKIPVIVPLISGGYLTHPRWGTSVRPGGMTIHYRKLFDGPELADLQPDEIHARLRHAMWNDDYDYQRRNGVTFKTKKGAEYLERLLFTCPACESVECMSSAGNRFYCQACGFETEWTPEGYLEPIKPSDQPRRSVTEWVSWQNAFCEKNIRRMREEKSPDTIFSDKEVTLKIGFKAEPLRTVIRGVMKLFVDRFSLAGDDGDERVFHLEDIDGVQVLLANKFEFYYKGSLFKFEFSNPRCSGYKYMYAIQKLAPEKTELQ